LSLAPESLSAAIRGCGHTAAGVRSETRVTITPRSVAGTRTAQSAKPISRRATLTGGTGNDRRQHLDSLAPPYLQRRELSVAPRARLPNTSRASNHPGFVNNSAPRQLHIPTLRHFTAGRSFYERGHSPPIGAGSTFASVEFLLHTTARGIPYFRHTLDPNNWSPWRVHFKVPGPLLANIDNNGAPAIQEQIGQTGTLTSLAHSSLPQGSGGHLTMDIGASRPAQYDQLAVSRGVPRLSHVELNLINGYGHAAGAVYPILTPASVTVHSPPVNKPTSMGHPHSSFKQPGRLRAILS